MAIKGKGRADYLQLGDWNAACYFCGRKRKASEMRKYWSGFWVCPEHWEPRHPQDFVRGVQDNQSVPWVQPTANSFVNICTPESISSLADYALADCAVSDFTGPFAPTDADLYIVTDEDEAILTNLNQGVSI